MCKSLKFILQFAFLLITLLHYPIEIEGLSNNIVKAITFDFGGVINKSDKRYLFSLLTKELKISTAEARKILKELSLAINENKSHEEFWIGYIAKTGKKLPTGWADKIKNAKSEAINENKKMLELVLELQKLGYQIPLLSNTTFDHANLIRNKGLYNYFYPVLLSFEIGFRKPDPKAFEILLHEINLNPENVIFIDDKEENVKTAIKMGIDGILFRNLEQLKKELIKRKIYN